jgi:porin
MSLEENHMSLHVSMHRATCAWAIVLGLVVLVMVSPVNAQPVDIPATWGGDFWSRPRLTGSWGGLLDELGKKGVVLDVDLLQTLQGVASGGRATR